MSTLDQVLAKTNADIQINVSVSETAKNRLLKKLRSNITLYLILALVFIATTVGGINQLSFPSGEKIYLVVILLFASAWNIFIYQRLRKIDIATLLPAILFSKTTDIKRLMLSGAVFFGINIAIFFTLLLPTAWTFNRFGFWAMIVGLIVAIIHSVASYYPKYIKLFRDLNSIKE